MVPALLHGVTAESAKACGRATACMDAEFSLGQMAADIRVSMSEKFTSGGGIFRYPNGPKYDGQWVNEDQEGIGIYSNTPARQGRVNEREASVYGGYRARSCRRTTPCSPCQVPGECAYATHEVHFLLLFFFYLKKQRNKCPCVKMCSKEFNCGSDTVQT